MWWMALLQAAQTGLSMAGASMQTEAAAKAADQNANIAEGQAADAYQQGAYQAGRLRTQASQVVGAQKAAYAASGVDVTQGTPVQTMAGTRFVSDLAIQQAHNNAARRAWGYKIEAQQFRDQAAWDRGPGMFFGAAGPALSGAGQIMASYGRSQAQQTPNIASGGGY